MNEYGPLPPRMSRRAARLIDNALGSQELRSRQAHLYESIYILELDRARRQQERADFMAFLFFCGCVVLAYLIGGML